MITENFSIESLYEEHPDGEPTHPDDPAMGKYL
jgi:hypothetical protein